LDLADLYRLNGSIADARDAANKAMTIDPNLYSVHATLGTIYAQEERWEDATSAFKTAIEARLAMSDSVRVPLISNF